MGNLCSSWFGCCGPLEKESSVKFAPASKRSCTDLLFLILYIMSWAGIIAVISVAASNGGNPNRIIHGVDYNDRICGSGSMSSRPYSAWLAVPPPGTNNCQGCFNIKKCFRNCDDIYGDPEVIDNARYQEFDTVLFLCLPSSSLLDYDSDFNSPSEMASRAFSDIFLTWPIILISAGVALAWAYCYEWLSKRWAGVLVFAAFATLTVGGFLCAYALLQKANNVDSTTSSRRTAMRALGIAVAILTGLFVLVVIALRKRIYIAVEVIKSASGAVLDMAAIVFFPFIPMFAGLVYFVLFIATTVLLASTWDATPMAWPGYFGATKPADAMATTYSYSFNQNLKNAFAYVFFHCLWTIQFLIYFCYLVIAGAVANWYFTPRDGNGNKIRGTGEGQLSNTPIIDSVYRTIRFHLGTIACGALIIAVIEFVRAVVKYIERQTAASNGGQPNRLQRCLFCFINCCLYCVQCCMDKVSKNAFIWTAIWGDSYASAACSSFKLIWSNLGRVAALSIVTNYILLVGKLLVAFATTGIAGVAMFRYYGRNLNSPVLPMVVVFVLAYMVAALFMSVVETVIDTVFICFLVDEKYNKASGHMLADKGLQDVINAHSEYCDQHAKVETHVASQRKGGEGQA